MTKTIINAIFDNLSPVWSGYDGNDFYSTLDRYKSIIFLFVNGRSIYIFKVELDALDCIACACNLYSDRYLTRKCTTASTCEYVFTETIFCRDIYEYKIKASKAGIHIFW